MEKYDGQGVIRSSMILDNTEAHIYDFSFDSDLYGNYYDEF